MKRFCQRAHHFQHKWPSLFYGLFTGHHGVDVVGNLQRADIDKIAKAHLLRFSHQRFSEQRKLRDVARQRGEALGIFSRGDDFRIFFRIDAETAKREAQGHVRRRSQPVDAADLTL